MTEVTIPIASGAKDGHITFGNIPDTWPPTGASAPVTVDTTSATNYAIFIRNVRHQQFNFTEVAIGCLIFDTSVIPDDATIIDAKLRAVIGDRYVGGSQFKDLEFEWYDYGAGISDDDYVLSLPSASAGVIPHATWAAWPLNTVQDIALSNPNANINKQGETGLRIAMEAGDPGVEFPSRDNIVTMYSFENASVDEAKLIVNYTVPQKLRPDADLATAGWSTAPLWSKIDEDTPDGVTITGVAS